MKDKPVASIMRQVPFVSPDASIGRALEYMKAAGTDALPVVNFGKLIGVIREKDLLDVINHQDPQSLLDTNVHTIMKDIVTAVRPWTTIGDTAEIMRLNDTQTAFVISDYGDYLGAVSRADVLAAILDTLKPASIAGMATPLGVYLTTGNLRSGPGDLGLFLGGIALMLMNYLAFGIVFGIAWLVQHMGYLNLLDIMLTSSAQLPDWAVAIRAVMYGLALIIFLILLRISPIAGYHAAEHQVVHTIENGDPLKPEYVSLHPRAHPRCGTNIVAAVIIFVILAQIMGTDVALMLTILVLIIGWRKIGEWLQNYITTKPATPKQIMNGIKAGEDLLAQFRANPSYNVTAWKRIWYSGIIQMMAGMAVAIGVADLIEKLVFHFI